MPNRRTLLALSLAASLLAIAPAARAQEPVDVVASFSILGDMTRRIGGDHVRVTDLVGPDADAHVFEPTPAHARLIGSADVLVTNGLEFEPWLPRLAETAGFRGETVVASAGIQAIPFAGEHDDEDEDGEDHAPHDHGAQEHHHHHHGEFDPHAWQDLRNAVVYSRNIVEGLSKRDPANSGTYRANGESYIAEIEALDAQVRAEIGAIPAERRKIVTGHDAFGYFARAYGVEFIAPVGASTEGEASAADVAAIIRQIRAENISAVFIENISNSRLVEQIASETDARLGGELYSDALSGPDGPAATYLAMFRTNVERIVAALARD